MKEKEREDDQSIWKMITAARIIIFSFQILHLRLNYISAKRRQDREVELEGPVTLIDFCMSFERLWKFSRTKFHPRKNCKVTN